jgi:membrane associated rhomboid family serine protease
VGNARHARRSLKGQIAGGLALVLVIWLAFLLDFFLPIDQLGLVPRTWSGLPGIVAMPLVHRDAPHLLSNTVPLIVLLTLLAGSHAQWWKIVTALVVLSGVLLWLVGRPAVHIGASSLVFGLITFLIAAGFLERRPLAMLVSVLVAVLYGTTLLWNIIPRGAGISWDGHLCGAAAGLGVAYGLARFGELNRRHQGTVR